MSHYYFESNIFRLTEMNYSLKNINQGLNEKVSKMTAVEISANEDIYLLAKSYFDLKEYDRAAYFLKDSQTLKAKFLYFYSLYLSGEKKKIDNMTDIPPDSLKNSNLKYLCNELQKEHTAGNLDGFGLYLYGVILKKLNSTKEATGIFIESIHKEPIHWGTWLELANLISDSDNFHALMLPNHWMKNFFIAHMYLELQLIDEAFAMYTDLQKSMGFVKNVYIQAQTAIAVHYKRGKSLLVIL